MTKPTSDFSTAGKTQQQLEAQLRDRDALLQLIENTPVILFRCWDLPDRN